MGEAKIVCVFTGEGHTFTFRDVDVVCDNEKVLVFKYKAMSDGLAKTGTFLKDRIVGYSITK